ncbi:hypothetical protein LLEC1_04496 [Akanthomyces lecanii]|uniref:Aminoglycoside phosphotransferase domain-containing protein n=1 Tax=Cordyceps confragosa TaxID=2714763 RepID=A0A179ICN4_CORDF|nr:hypothetical protein LLEC1_04496 [Akanthomyces lecanii]
MLFTLIQSLLSRWKTLLWTLIRKWSGMTISPKSSRDVEQCIENEARDTLQPNTTHLQQTKEAFIRSIQPRAIEALAQKHNNQKPCRIFGRENGSFNVCFFLEFPDDGARWVVRVPIEPALQQAWEKLESEVATVTYIQSMTTIPVPRIHAYGKGEVLTDNENTTQMFLISDYISGKPLIPELLYRSARPARSRLFRQIFDVLLQLRELEFDTIGSLMPNAHGTPQVSHLLTFSLNELPGVRLPTFATAREFMTSQFDVLLQHAALPAPDFTESDAKFERFAIHSLQSHFESLITDELNYGPFLLNIIVNDELELQGVIDWEFAHIVPLPLFVPPSWATDHDDCRLRSLGTLFRTELRDAARHDQRYSKLIDEWYAQESDAFHIAHIIRYPGDVSSVFDEYFAKKLYGEDLDKAETDFFEQAPLLKSKTC